MLRSMNKSKIHRAVVTEANLAYTGSITIDEKLMQEADLIENEKVLVVDVNNGARFETYVIPGKYGEGEICLNGAAARMGLCGDLVIIMSFALYNEEECKNFKPKHVYVDQFNHTVKIS